MESRKVVLADKTTVAIEVNPQVTEDTVIFVNGDEAGGKNHNTAFKGFFKAQPKALGTVQIMNGAMVFILGFILTSSVYSYSAILDYSGINYWGALIYVSAGSLSVTAQNKYPCLVKASLGLNLFSAITAGMAIVLMGVQIALLSLDLPSLYDEYFILRVTGILLVFTILQFIISICISAFVCEAVCNKNSTVVNVH
ncbi:membrane-spanning 4-domains subfamily A member 8-like [Puntigrus tetrazona]|uniref:membrane-spanning 4-domains subfamily A member 8-like n=1 Tax=Puntigrus tetrazona TaxID=1606681 RepID=UPI001C8AED18|nr:membrane-spanning 4-domains subfamily A member 8-like [Puntigrus tetrazona]